MGGDITLAAIGFAAGKAAIDEDVVLQLESGLAITAAGRFVSSFGHPDFDDISADRLGRSQGSLQVGVGVAPGAAIIGPGGVGIYVDHRGGNGSFLNLDLKSAGGSRQHRNRYTVGDIGEYLTNSPHSACAPWFSLTRLRN